MVALTFDDGPGPDTSDIIRELLKHEVPATFFVVGSIVDTNPQIVRRMEREGFSVQSHSYMHSDLSKMLDVPLEHDLTMTSDAIVRAKREGSAPSCMRPPWGNLRRDQFDNIAALGQQPVVWDVDPEDWAPGTPEEIAASVIEQVRDGGSIILLHDGGGDRKRTLTALPIIITTLKSEGYTFVELPCL